MEASVIVELAENCPLLDRGNVMHLNHFLTSVVVHGRNYLARPEPKRLIELAHQSVGDVYGEFLRQSYKKILNSGQRWVWHDGCGGCDPAAVSKFYNMVTVVIVENISTDGAWLTLVASRLRPRLRAAMAGQSPFMDFQQAGGNGEIPKLVQRIAPRYSRLRPGGAPLKVVVVTDSDADRPGQISAD